MYNRYKTIEQSSNGLIRFRVDTTTYNYYFVSNLTQVLFEGSYSECKDYFRRVNNMEKQLCQQ